MTKAVIIKVTVRFSPADLLLRPVCPGHVPSRPRVRPHARLHVDVRRRQGVRRRGSHPQLEVQ